MVTRLLWLGLLSAAAACIAQDAAAQAAEAPSVLILQSLDSQTDPYLTVTQTFRARFQSHYGSPVSFAEISLDARWGGRRDRELVQVELIGNRLAIHRADLVVCIGPSAIDFWNRYGDRIAADTPTLAAARESFIEATELAPGDAGVFSEWSIPHAVDHILSLLPDTREIVVVFGASQLERAQTEEARRRLAGYSDQVRFSYTSDLAMDEIVELVSQLPEGSAVLLGIFSVDARGLMFPLSTGAERLLAASRAPVFSAFDVELGLGVVGGRLIPLRRLGEAMADEAAELLAGPPGEPVVRVVSLSEPTYDWRALRRWDIDTARLPPDSRILFREPTAWSKYRTWIALIVGVVTVQAFMIASLLTQRRQLRNAERAGTRLSSRLISAHEDERRRIANELHDDLSQRLAGLAIDAALVGSDPGNARNPELLQQMHPELVRISKDVHDLSYRLHPSIVEELGLVPAMRSEMERIRRVSGLRIEDRIEPLATRPSRDIALCLYRITQESLQNAVRHADTTVVAVALRQGRRFYVLEIRDEGKGFEVSNPELERGIGISGMRERARGVGGALRVFSSPGRGTRVSAKLPVREARDETDQHLAGG